MTIQNSSLSAFSLDPGWKCYILQNHTEPDLWHNAIDDHQYFCSCQTDTTDLKSAISGRFGTV